jgi:hypothetical protein
MKALLFAVGTCFIQTVIAQVPDTSKNLKSSLPDSIKNSFGISIARYAYAPNGFTPNKNTAIQQRAASGIQLNWHPHYLKKEPFPEGRKKEPWFPGALNAAAEVLRAFKN